MIIITGPGRSGTSFMAAAYREAGANPGGEWQQRTNAGYEDHEVVRVNNQLCVALGQTLLGVSYSAPIPAISGKLRDFLPVRARRGLVQKYNKLWWNRPNGVSGIDWAKFDHVARAYEATIRPLASGRSICKDPQFCLTLPVWAEVGARIDHVIIMTRNVDDSLASRVRANHLNFKSRSAAKNASIYAIGNVFATVSDYSLRHTVVRFPDVLHRTDEIAPLLPRPDGVASETLAAALRQVADHRMVRAGSVGR